MGELVFGDDTYDVENVVWSTSRKRIVAVAYEAEKPRVVYFDEVLAARQRIIDESLPHTVNTQIEATEDGAKVVIFARSDREPGVYYFFDAVKKKIEEIAVVRPAIDPQQMAEVKPIVYRARDGATIHGYLTLPAGREPKKLPLLIHPHGGPFGIRDHWGFDSEVQFLANRGYAVLQPNYRGSGGYGTAFERLGYRQWGRAMQDDLTDAVQWAVAEGVADPARVGIIGASYGGYAVMAGLAFTPEVYRVGVNYVGVTDLTLLARQRREIEWLKLWSQTRLGDAFDDAEELKARSPVFHADKIQAPVLMAYGRSDPRVTREHGDDMKAALAKHGKTFEFLIESGEGHGFRKEEKSIAFYAHVAEFLKEQLLGRANVRVGDSKVIDIPARP
jgi:dipeptidyl aminopeptidase/acylaminoacyl peptidase